MNERMRFDPAAAAHAGKLSAAGLPMPDISDLIGPDQPSSCDVLRCCLECLDDTAPFSVCVMGVRHV